ncbi:MAG: non-canonical purine NTP pyrophosphatase [Patescibacteria group bacterium]|nr:non-canonical purine NTP pyrophosphatase [Patescibacteria group bacterium]
MILIMGTKNQAKVEQIRGILEALDIDLQVLPAGEYDEAAENADNAVENAAAKARHYSSILGLPVLSMDNALYFKDLPNEAQPGINVRRLPGAGSRPSDSQLLHYYKELVASLGGQAEAYWEYGLALAYPDGAVETALVRSPRIFVSQPSLALIPGYPLESIQIDPSSGIYIAAMNAVERTNYWQKSIGRGIRSFIENSRFYQTR